MVTLQVTFSSTKGYKPMSTTVLIGSKKEYLLKRKEIIQKAMYKICAQRGMTFAEMERFGYTEVKSREVAV